MIKALFFDIDDTLLDFQAYTVNALRDGFKKFGLRPYEDWMIKRFHEENSKLWRQIEMGTISLKELQMVRFNKIFRALGISADGAEFEKYFRNELFTSAIKIEGADELLKALHGKYIVCTASNGPYRQQLNRIAVAGWSDYFDYMCVSEKYGVSKPSSYFFEKAFDEIKAGGHDILPEEILMVGDSLTSDMAGGRENGLKTCWFNRSDNEDCPVTDYTIHNLLEILDILEER